MGKKEKNKITKQLKKTYPGRQILCGYMPCAMRYIQYCCGVHFAAFAFVVIPSFSFLIF